MITEANIEKQLTELQLRHKLHQSMLEEHHEKKWRRREDHRNGNKMTTEIESIIVLPGEGYGLAFEETAAQTHKLALIKNSKLIVEVTDAASCDVARSQVKELAKWRTSVEKCREIIKAPILAKGREVDALAKAAVLETDIEEKRLTGLIGSHAAKVEADRQAEIRRQQEAERARIAEEQRIAREAAEAAAKAEAARKAAEDAEFADDDSEAEKAKAEAAAAEAARLKLEQEQAAAARAAELERQKSFALPVAEKVEGVKFEPDFEVLDAAAVYAAFPELVKLEVKRADTLARIKSFMERNGGELPDVPGLSITKKAVVSKR